MRPAREDPDFRRDLRETRAILSLLAAVTAAVLAICYLWGYRPDPGVRAVSPGVVRLDPAQPGVIRVEPPPAPEVSPPEGVYRLPAGATVRVSEGQAVGYGALLAAPGSRPLVPTIAGFPRWVFWGIFVPWGLCSAITLWFAGVSMRDHAGLPAAEGEAIE